MATELQTELAPERAAPKPAQPERGSAPANKPARAGRGALAIAGEKLIEFVIRLCGISAIIFVFSIFFFVFREAAPLFFQKHEPPAQPEAVVERHADDHSPAAKKFALKEFLFSKEWYPTSQSNVRFGVLALIVGTLSVTALAMIIAVPFGLGAAVFVSEFCGGKIKETLKIVIELLAAIPSVVWGFIGLTVMNPIIQDLFHAPIGLNMLNGAILLALMSVPIMVSIGEDSLKAVPDSFREAGLALGATRWQLVYRVLLPAAKNGLLAAVLLGVGRAVGETMAVLMATGHAVNIPFVTADGSFNPLFIFEPVRTLTATIAAELGEASEGSQHYRVLFLIGVLLFSMTFIVNLTADLIIRGIKKR
ncbi:MAG: phosphate ABC transporter permease subunit PstC [Verrucomicrobia subdivision 3 bacterium]|nr:phosphate ABC transporter permease subunit PstC [Limisphaerales bacterium]